MITTSTLSPHQLRQIAALGIVHPTTVARYYRGLSVRSTTSTRIEAAAKSLGFFPFAQRL